MLHDLAFFWLPLLMAAWISFSQPCLQPQAFLRNLRTVHSGACCCPVECMPNFCRDSYARKRLKELYGSFEFHARGMMGKSYRCTVVVARMLRSALANESAQERAVTCGIVLDSGRLLWTGVEADSPVRSIFVDRRCPPLFCRHVIVNSANAECTSNFRLPNKSKRSKRDGHVRAYMLAGPAWNLRTLGGGWWGQDVRAMHIS